MKKRYFIAGGAALLLAAVGVILFNLRPVHFKGSRTVCTIEGQTAQVEFDVTFYKHLWKSSKMKGTMTVNNKEYRSVRPDYSDTIWFDPVPVNKPFENYIMFFKQEDDLERFNYVLRDGDESCIYFGPAATAGEAENILESIINIPKK